MKVRDQLLRLVRLQGIAHETRTAREVVEGAPARIEEIEARFRERNAEYVAVKERFDALETDRRTRSSELDTLEESKTKYMADLMQVQNQREYAAMLKEIDAVKAQIAEHEEAILRDMEEIDTVKTELANHEEHIKSERVKVAEEIAEVEAATAKAQDAIAELEAERGKLEGELPRSLVASVQRLEQSRQGQFLAQADDGVCQSCFVRVRPQGFQEVKLATKIHYCSNCRRLLYHDPSLRRIQAELSGQDDPASAGKDESNKIEAVDGGAV